MMYLKKSKISKCIEIGLFGAPINNGNLGCKALTYSMVNIIKQIEEDLGICLNLNIFEYNPKYEKYKLLCNTLKIKSNNDHLYKLYDFANIKTYFKHPIKCAEAIIAIKKCDLVIDLSEGDSFSDIYGIERFNLIVSYKNFIIHNGIPLLLGPQTYGPYLSKEAKIKAKYILNNSFEVVSRDQESAQRVEKLTNRKVLVLADLAFLLPYETASNKKNKKKVIGINVSGLLVKEKYESNGNAGFDLKTDYDEFIFLLIRRILLSNSYEICLIPHVISDVYACMKYEEKFSNVKTLKYIEDPVKMKTQISNLDVFVGSRMHACIAAFSAGVVTIPIAYSVKFKSLFELFDYRYTVDLTNVNIEKAIQLTFSYLEQADEIKKDLDISHMHIESYSKKTKYYFREQIQKIYELKEQKFKQ